MKKLIFPVFLLILFPGIISAIITPGNLSCENLRNPIAIDILNPKLSWINTAQDNEKGQMQTAWEIRVAGSRDNLMNGKADLWNSGRIISGQSPPQEVPFPGHLKVRNSIHSCQFPVKPYDPPAVISLLSAFITLRMDKEYAVFNVKSGNYSFVSSLPEKLN